MSALSERWNICYYSLFSSFIASYILCSVSLLILTAISVDRLLALSLGLRYRQVVTLKRTCVIGVMFWVVSIFYSTMYIRNYIITIRSSHIVIILCLATSIFSYTKIFLRLHHHQTQVEDITHHGQPSQTMPLNIRRYKKAVSSTLWLQPTLAVCYIPHGIVTALSTHSGLSPSLVLGRQFTLTLVYLNSSINPIVYCWKMRVVRQAIKDTIKTTLLFIELRLL